MAAPGALQSERDELRKSALASLSKELDAKIAADAKAATAHVGRQIGGRMLQGVSSLLEAMPLGGAPTDAPAVKRAVGRGSSKEDAVAQGGGAKPKKAPYKMPSFITEQAQKTAAVGRAGDRIFRTDAIASNIVAGRPTTTVGGRLFDKGLSNISAALNAW